MIYTIKSKSKHLNLKGILNDLKFEVIDSNDWLRQTLLKIQKGKYINNSFGNRITKIVY